MYWYRYVMPGILCGKGGTGRRGGAAKVVLEEYRQRWSQIYYGRMVGEKKARK